MLNEIIIQGRLTRDPEIRQTQSGASVCTTTLACEREFKDQNGNRATDFVDCVLWRTTADFFCKHFRKGDMTVVKGSMQSRKWTDKQGNNRIAWEVQVSGVYFCGGKNTGGNQSAGGEYGGGQEEGGARAGGPVYVEYEEEDGELPF